MSNGVYMVHQRFSPVPTFTVLENLFLIVKRGFTSSLEFSQQILRGGSNTSAQDIIKNKYPDKYPLQNLLDIRFEERKESALVGAWHVF
jgi:basic membrane protein A